jgi:hypothetical protein
MMWRILLLLLIPAAAHAQFSVVVTELGSYNSADGPEYAAQCARDACRATLPVQVGAVRCVLNVRVGARNEAGVGQVMFAGGPCESGVTLAIDEYHSQAFYKVDHFGATSKMFMLPFRLPAEAHAGGHDDPLMDDGVYHFGVGVRLDIIATQNVSAR